MIAVNEVERVFSIQLLEPGDHVRSLDAVVRSLGSHGCDDGEFVVSWEQEKGDILSGRPWLGNDEKEAGLAGLHLQVVHALLPLTVRERESDHIRSGEAVVRERRPRASRATAL